MLLYICQDGIHPSGVASYGYAVLRHRADARMLLLNASQPPTTSPPDLRSRMTVVPEDSSHDPAAVAAAIAALVAAGDGPVTLLPNTGDTPWAAVAAFLRAATPADLARVRVLGIVHSDMDTQYRIAVDYAPISPVWIGVSRRCARTLRTRLATTGASVRELPCSVAIPGPRPTPRAKGPLRLAYVGRIEEPQKRVSRLVDVFKALDRLGCDFTATVAGDGPAVTAFAAALAAAGPGIDARVTRPGAVSPAEVEAIWRSHDVCLLVSAYEGLPISLLEAMAGGACPVVMAVESGLPELLVNRRNARVVPQGDARVMAEVLDELSRDHEQLDRIGRAARASVAATCSPERHFARLEAIVHECRARPQPPRLTFADPTGAAIANCVTRAREAGRPVAVYGAGMFGRKVVDACLASGVEVCALFDSDAARRDMVYRGLRCAGPEAVIDHPDAVFVAGSLQFADAMAGRIRAEFAAAGRSAPVVLVPTP